MGLLNRLIRIGKVMDRESNLGDFGVRKYDDELGRFNSVVRLMKVLWLDIVKTF